MLIVFLTTFGIEFLQYFMGRSADIDDVITNFLGGLIGYILFLAFNKLLTTYFYTCRRQEKWTIPIEFYL